MAALLGAAVLGIVWWQGSSFVDAAGAFIVISTPSAEQLHQATAQLVPLVDQAISLMTSVVFGLFVFVGFAVKPPASGHRAYDLVDAIAGAAFVVVAFFAIYFGYATRLQAVDLLAQPLSDMSGLKTVRDTLLSNIARQAFWIGLMAISSIFLAVRSFLYVPASPAADGSFPVTITVNKEGKAKVEPPGALE